MRRTMRTVPASINETEYEVVEWIDGERVALDEYEARLSNEILGRASQYLLQISDDFNWIFGFPE